MHLQFVWANHLHSTTSTNHTVATRERTFVIQAREFLWFRLSVHDMYNPASEASAVTNCANLKFLVYK